MRDVNKVILVGRLGADPVQRSTRAGTCVAHFPLATGRRVRKEGDAEGEYTGEETQWHDVVAWGREGENCAQFLRKGNLAYVEGSIRSHRYEGKDGVERTSFEIHADSVSFLPGRARSEAVREVPADSLPETLAASG